MKTITKNEYLQLLGLLAITTKHYAMINQCEKAFAEIIGEADQSGHTMDILCGSRDLDEGLEIMKVSVTAPMTGSEGET